VENSLAAAQSLARRERALRDAAQEQQRALSLTETSLRVGRADRRALAQQQLNNGDAQMALLAVRTEALAQRVNLHLALGGSFEPPPEPPPEEQEQAQTQTQPQTPPPAG
jgi:outer membrane protein, multidrug efflux system